VAIELSELELERSIARLAAEDIATHYVSFLGGGTYRHHSPAAVRRLAARTLTAGGAAAYRALRAELDDWNVSAAVLAGLPRVRPGIDPNRPALARGVAAALAVRPRRRVGVSRALQPAHRARLAAEAEALRCELVELPVAVDGTTDLAAAGAGLDAIVVQSPNVLGTFDLPTGADAERLAAAGVVVVVLVLEALALAVADPSAAGAAVVVCEGRSFGLPLAFGGPRATFVATSAELRDPGEPEEADGGHVAGAYLRLLGSGGLAAVADVSRARARALEERVTAAGFARRFSGATFNEAAFRVPAGWSAAAVLAALRRQTIVGGLDLGPWYPEYADCLLIAATELATERELAVGGGARAARASEPPER